MPAAFACFTTSLAGTRDGKLRMKADLLFGGLVEIESFETVVFLATPDFFVLPLLRPFAFRRTS
jgi:hypothetical protein